MDAGEQREAQDRLERDYLAGSLSADEYTRLRRALHDDASGVAAAAEPTFASWGSRAAGFLLDWVVLFFVIFVAAFIFIAAGDAGDALLAFTILLLPALYQWLLTGAWGQTLGKMAVGIRVVRASDGAPVGYLRALGRVASSWVLGLFVLPLLVAYLWPLWDARNQTLYDKMAGTIVVRDD